MGELSTEPTLTYFASILWGFSKASHHRDSKEIEEQTSWMILGYGGSQVLW
jgi:hypothetical protein